MKDLDEAIRTANSFDLCIDGWILPRSPANIEKVSREFLHGESL